MINIIGLLGLAGHGKDTVGEMIVNSLPSMQKYALADPIKDITRALFGWGESECFGNLKEIPVLQYVTPDRLDMAATFYNGYGLDEYKEFHDAWEDWIALFGLHYEDGYYMSSDPVSPRQIFQYFGTEWGRSIDDEIWLKLAPTENVVITDIRFMNEAQFFVDKGATLIKVTSDRKTRCTSEHSSENLEVHEAAHIEIENNGTLEQLEKSVFQTLVYIDLSNPAFKQD